MPRSTDLELGGVEENTHQNTAEGTGNWNGHDPRKQEKTNSLEVDSLQSSIAEANADGGASNAHGGRDGERELREDEDSDGSAHLHRATSAGRVVGDLVTHD